MVEVEGSVVLLAEGSSVVVLVVAVVVPVVAALVDEVVTVVAEPLEVPSDVLDSESSMGSASGAKQPPANIAAARANLPKCQA